MTKQMKLDIIKNRYENVKNNSAKNQEWKNHQYANLMTELESEFQMNLFERDDNDKDVINLYLEISDSRDFSNY